MDNILFKGEIQIWKDDILIGHCWNLFNVLDGNILLDMEINKNNGKDKQEDKNKKKMKMKLIQMQMEIKK